MRRLLSTLAVSSLAAVLLASTGAGAPRELWPGVTFEQGVQFTTRGPVAINVLRGKRIERWEPGAQIDAKDLLVVLA